MLILLCSYDREFAEDLLSQTTPDDLDYLWDLGNAITLFPNSFGASMLRSAVIDRFGTNWEELYQESIRQHYFDD